MKSFDEFEIALQYLDAKSIDYIVIGDLNCDVTKTVPSCQTRRLLNIIADYGLKQFVSKPTRITPLSATTIDVLFSSNHEHVQYCDVAPITLSDHYMVVASVGKVKTASSNHKYINSRNLKNLNFVEFCNELRNASWDNVFCEQDTNTAYENMVSIYTNILDKFAPMKRRRVKQKSAPWMNADIKSLMIERDNCKKNALKSKKNQLTGTVINNCGIA